ncbi:unnamed protein product [Soboliphyme baturini]|uniref:DUF1513 domain-containing protein n=1 Tax=Soboliphyme baturini TaxID=241478 RepID=A0A183J0R8_9BILA|nr:unnamed protein product [Soboliphyme baturini]
MWRGVRRAFPHMQKHRHLPRVRILRISDTEAPAASPATVTHQGMAACWDLDSGNARGAVVANRTGLKFQPVINQSRSRFMLV